jgi:alkylated DNA repair protein alkB family protein 6
MKPFGVWLPRRSLLFFDGAAYTKCLHGIESVTEDAVDESVVNWRCAVDSCGDVRRREGTRVSVTCRNVLKVRKLLMFK